MKVDHFGYLTFLQRNNIECGSKNQIACSEMSNLDLHVLQKQFIISTNDSETKDATKISNIHV